MLEKKMCRITAGDIMYSDVASITELDLSNEYESPDEVRISDITALGNLTSLTKLILSCNRISDLSALGSLTSLQTLDLRDNKISDYWQIESLDIPHLYR